MLLNLLGRSALCHTHGCLDGFDVIALSGHSFVYFTIEACFQLILLIFIRIQIHHHNLHGRSTLLNVLEKSKDKNSFTFLLNQKIGPEL